MDHWAEVGRGRYYLEHGNPDLALQAVSAIHDEAPGAPEGMSIAGQALLMRGNVSPARRVLEHSLKLKPEQPDVAKSLAAIYLAAGDGQRAITLLKKAAAMDPRDFRPWYALGKVYHELGNLEESASAFAEALLRSPPAAEASESRIGRIRSLLDANRGDSAATELEELRKQSPENPDVLALASRLNASRGNWTRRCNWLILPWHGIPTISTPSWPGLGFASSFVSCPGRSRTFSVL